MKVKLIVNGHTSELIEEDHSGQRVPKERSANFLLHVPFEAQHGQAQVQLPVTLILPRARIKAGVDAKTYAEQVACATFAKEFARSGGWNFFRSFDFNLNYREVKFPKPDPAFEVFAWSEEIDVPETMVQSLNDAAKRIAEANEAFEAAVDALSEMARDGDYQGRNISALISYIESCTRLCGDLMYMWYAEKTPSIRRLFTELAGRKNRNHPNYRGAEEMLRSTLYGFSPPSVWAGEPPSPQYVRQYLPKKPSM